MYSFHRSLLVAIVVFLPLTADAQIQELGSEGTLDIATWNIEWFGSSSNGPSNDDIQVQNVADIIMGSGVDIWAVQEIVDVNRAMELDSMLPDYWESILASESGQQRIGFMWDSRVLQLRQSTHILQSFNYEFAGRPPLKAEFNVTLPDTSFVATFITVHMKAFSDQTSYERRVEAAKRVKNHIDFTSLSSQPVFFLGDFNDELTASTYNRQPSPYVPFLDDTDDYAVLTWPLEQDGGYSFQSGSFLDHIVVSNEANEMWLQGSTQVMTNLVTVNSFYARTSDHLPVMASFGNVVGTGIQEEDVFPVEPIITSLYPNPVSGTLNVSINEHFAGIGADKTSVVSLVDMLGRVVYSEVLFEGDIEIDVTPYAAGVYALRVESGDSFESDVLVIR
ncbi:MAG: T9SS type A sorting domain-containing protein [Bacteroidetes bacterium]|nr:T9SS type A sorting domain-containing protein [Bacteroidota bacterium]MDA1333336.1 T9SS type A sorting domain-containing protein [Bacteroidota bacterium]